MASALFQDHGSRALRAISAVLPRAADVRPGSAGEGADLVVNGRPIQVKWLGDGELRHVRARLPRLSGETIVAARRLSPGARAALSDAGVGWVDETGAAEISLSGVIVSRSGQPPKAPDNELRWTPAVLAVAEALLCGTAATVSAVKGATGVSAGRCATALRNLTDRGLLVADARRGRLSGRRVENPDELLDAYAAAAAAAIPKAAIQVGVTWRDPVSGLKKLGEQWLHGRMAWAATGAAAAAVIAPYLTSINTATVYVGAETLPGLEAAADAVGLRPMEGGRLTLRPFPTVTARQLATVEDGLRVVPWPRIYADLRAAGVRGEEAAEHLREVVRGR